MLLWYLPAQKNDFSPFLICKPSKLMPRDVNVSMYSCGKSSPTTATTLTFGKKKAADKAMYVQDPPMILSVFPYGVSKASNATVPMDNKLIINVLTYFRTTTKGLIWIEKFTVCNKSFIICGS